MKKPLEHFTHLPKSCVFTFILKLLLFYHTIYGMLEGMTKTHSVFLEPEIGGKSNYFGYPALFSIFSNNLLVLAAYHVIIKLLTALYIYIYIYWSTILHIRIFNFGVFLLVLGCAEVCCISFSFLCTCY